MTGTAGQDARYRCRSADGTDAIVVGGGPNGLAAAVTLAGAGLRVLVLEGSDTIGGGCRTEQLTVPGVWHDVCSAAHPLAVASPFFRRFNLAARGVQFAHPPIVAAHPLDGGRAGVVHRSVRRTAAGLGRDSAAYQRLLGPLASGDAVADVALSALRRPPRPSRALAAFAWRGLLPATVAARSLHTDEGRALVAGAAAHAMLPLSTPPTGGIGLLLLTLAHTAGWPVVAGGSARITDAMADALTASGGTVETGRWVRSLAELPPARVVLLDVAPRALLAMAGDRLPGGYARALRRFRYGAGVCKVDFALSGPVPWSNPDARRAGTLHLGGRFEEIAAAEAQVASGRHPDSPYVLVVQPAVADPGRVHAGMHPLWAYTHVPAGSPLDVADRVQAQIERFAPGFTDLVLARVTRTAAAEQAHNPNYVGGDIGTGAQTIRQVVARPAARWNPYRTPLRGVYLCSAATAPGPGVHGRCGELAALAALCEVFGIRIPPDISPARLPGTAAGQVCR
jgi:phytoene dehydrogenase-like protein